MATAIKEPATKTKKNSAGKEKKAAASKPTAKKTTADAAAVTKPSTSARVSGKATEKRTVVAKSKVAKNVERPARPTPEERYRMVETAAYFIAERSGFQGDSAAHWAAAELEIAALLKEGNASSSAATPDKEA